MTLSFQNIVGDSETIDLETFDDSFLLPLAEMCYAKYMFEYDYVPSEPEF